MGYFGGTAGINTVPDSPIFLLLKRIICVIFHHDGRETLRCKIIHWKRALHQETVWTPTLKCFPAHLWPAEQCHSLLETLCAFTEDTGLSALDTHPDSVTLASFNQKELPPPPLSLSTFSRRWCRDRGCPFPVLLSVSRASGGAHDPQPARQPGCNEQTVTPS